MEKNLGNLDKTIRIIAAISVAAFYYSGAIPETMALIVALPIGILLVTGFAGFCPLYVAFGLSSCKKPENNQ